MATPIFAQTAFGGGTGRTLLGIEIQGIREMVQALEALGARAGVALQGVLYREAERIMTEAKKQTPVLTGSLRASGHVMPPTVQSDAATVELHFGGPAGVGNHGGQTNRVPVHYAVYVHESLEMSHTNGSAKFLEAPVLEWAKDAESRLAFALWKEILPVSQALSRVR